MSRRTGGEEPEAPMPGTQGADYCFHTQFDKSCIETNYRGAATRWAQAQQQALDDLVLIASDARYKV